MNTPSGADDAPISILIVEDSPSLLRLYSHILSQAGYRILEAATGRAALQILWDQRPDIVLLDRVLPDMDGGDICRSIKEQPEFATSYVVMLSALKTSEDDRVSGLEAGADDYIVKPVGRRELLARIQVAARLRRTQLALQASEVMFRTLAENSPDMISRFDRDLRYIYTNRSVQRITGGTPEAYLGAPIDQAPFPHELMDFWRRSLAQVFEKGEAVRIEYDLPFYEEMRSFDAHLVPEFDADGVIRSVLAVSRDFTDRVHAEQEIARLATVVEQAVETVLITDTHGLIVYANAAFEAMTGCRAADILGQSLPDLRSHLHRRLLQPLSLSDCGGHPLSGFDAPSLSIRHAVRDRDRLSHPRPQRRYHQLRRHGDINERRRAESEREALLSVAASLRKAATRAEMLPIVLDQIMSARST